MSRKHFYPVSAIPIEELLLDTGNPRIRQGADQKDCLERILRRKRTFMNLLRDIAEHGLTIEPIVVSRNEDGKWMVRDGNRRVAALKLLRDPQWCPDEVLRKEIERLTKKHPDNVLNAVDCLASDDEEMILRYLELRHTGANDGVGQETWSALTKATFNLNHRGSDPNKRALQVLQWAEEQGLKINDDFPVTTLTRILNKDTLQLMGFRVKDDRLDPIIDTESALRIVGQIVLDIGSQTIKVDNVFTPGLAYNYVAKVRAKVLPTGPISIMTDEDEEQDDIASDTTDAPASSGRSVNTDSEGIAPGRLEKEEAVPPVDSKPRRTSSPRKPSWDRPCIFPRRKPDLCIPDEATKTRNVVTELLKLDVRDTPIAVAVLLRTLIDLSEQHYSRLHSLPDKDKFYKRVLAAAEHMFARGEITAGQKEVILRRTREQEGILHVTTLHKYVHSPDFHPTAQVVNTLWDELGFFVKQCWESKP
ncbi:MAG: ParB/Srx family N-terminal domain-containing protein [Bacillota bacterium]|nr:ParB/Srx family N-terminal domain-containing protein [Bacillota bacterium]